MPEGVREQGAGARAMEQLVAWADANDKHLALTPSADFGGDRKRLVDFYKRFGFKENKGKGRVFSVSEGMIRENPNGRTLYSHTGDQAADAMTMPEQSARAGRRRGPKIDEAGLIRAMELQFPSLVKPVQKMLERGKQGQRGGLVLIDSVNPEKIAQVFASATGRSMDSAVEAIGEHGAILGFFDLRSAMTFMVGPRLNPVTAPAVLLHEAMHGKQRAAIDAKALSLIERRNRLARPLRQFLDGVAARMEDAGEAGNVIEASTYIVEQAVIAGCQAGFSAVDGKLMDWIGTNIGRQVGNLVREFVTMIRAWGPRSSCPWGRCARGRRNPR